MQTGTLEDAIELAVKHFRGVCDKGGQPYILHLLRVMLQVDDPEGQIVGVLHDIVEDTSIELEDLRRSGFSARVVEAVDCLTHASSDSYAEYVSRIKRNPLARLCKLADLNDNYRLDRVVYRDGHAHDDARRVQRYILSHQFLSDKIDAGTYSRLMKSLE